MEKVSEYLLKYANEDDEREKFPTLSKDEEKEILEQLGIEDFGVVDGLTAAQRIRASFKTVREFSLATGPAAEEVENDDEYVDYGTVIIKTKSGRSTQGTLRVKKGDNHFGSIVFRDVEVSHDDLPDAFDTMRVIETNTDSEHPDWSGFGKSPAEGNFIWRAPEEWEVNIIALERGEWAENMPESAFRKYKKERPKLNNLFNGSASASRLHDHEVKAAPADGISGNRKLSQSAENSRTTASSLALSESSDEITSPPEKKKKRSKKGDREKKEHKESKSEKDSSRSEKDSSRESKDKESKESLRESKESKESSRESKESSRESKEKDQRSPRDYARESHRERREPRDKDRDSRDSAEEQSKTRGERRWAVFRRNADIRRELADS